MYLSIIVLSTTSSVSEKQNISSFSDSLLQEVIDWSLTKSSNKDSTFKETSWTSTITILLNCISNTFYYYFFFFLGYRTLSEIGRYLYNQCLPFCTFLVTLLLKCSVFLCYTANSTAPPPFPTSRILFVFLSKKEKKKKNIIRLILTNTFPSCFFPFICFYFHSTFE